MNNTRVYQLVLRSIAVILHIIINVVIITTLMDLDITGSWLYTIGFILIVLLLLALLIVHLFSYFHFIKTKT
jgi:hypothetical protein